MKIFVSDVVMATANAMRGEFSKRELLSPSRDRRLVAWRYASMRVARRLTGRSTGLIGMVYNRDHTTVIHGLRAKYDTQALEAQITAELGTLITERRKRLAAAREAGKSAVAP